MKIFIEPSREEWKDITRRVERDDRRIEGTVRDILERVRRDGDKALLELAWEIDKVSPEALSKANPASPLWVSPEEFENACRQVPDDLKEAISKAKENIGKFHLAQRPSPVMVETTPGVMTYQRAVPIRRVGLYIPGGSAPLFSTVLMLCIPAVIAGCNDIVLCTPPSREGGVNPCILYAAYTCGVARILKAGGAQAIAAMAYGTESLERRDKIFGPGNRYVMKAKQMVSSECTAIDMPAGPSEVMVVADETAVPSYVASDLLSQAEHGTDSQAMLVCSSEEIAGKVLTELNRQLEKLSRREALERSLEGSAVVVLSSRESMTGFANEYAPEHLILSVEKPWEMAEGIYAAGSIFIGNYSPESAGDYASGTNHTLPTSGWARSFSGVGLDSFLRRISYQEIDREGLERLGGTIVTMAGYEGLDAHANAVKVRLQKN